jgi:RHS repeat-associated protein
LTPFKGLVPAPPDAFGNRWIGPTQSTGLPALTLETPQAQCWDSTTVPNRIASWTYDGNGNVLGLGTVARTFSYDAENLQVTATIGSGTSTYVYDGLGQRVSKSVNGQITTYVYDAFGNLAAEYGGDSSGCGTCYVTTDHLGTTRLLTNSAGNVFARYDYEPFGTEIGANYDGRTTAMGFTAMLDDTNPKFTGQMRDQETTLDFFSVRYMSGAQGRFQSPDPGNAGADPSNPQSWNGYAYVANNPLSYTDPSGMFTCVSCEVDESGNPVAIGIAAAVDIGELLAGLFGFGGGPPPSIPSSLATPSSPIMGPTFSVTGWGTADTVAPSWSAVGGTIPVVIPGLTFYAQGTGQAGRSGAPSQNNSPCTLTTPGGIYTLGPNAVPHFQLPMANALTNAFNNLNSEGITPQIPSGFRSPADQMRMRNGASGPNPAAVVSWHEVGMAVDINGTASSYFSKIISAMKGQGLTWGGNFSHRDPPHFQLPRAGTRPPAAMVSACGGG